MKNHFVWLATGTNLGNRQQAILHAAEILTRKAGKIIKASPLYETEPWGKKDQNWFLNQVLLVSTSLSANDLLRVTEETELLCGRKKRLKWQAREMDVDILFYDDQIIQNENLTIPHPYLHQRRFVLAPLADISPDKKHPGLNKTIAELLQACTDPLDVHVFKDQVVK